MKTKQEWAELITRHPTDGSWIKDPQEACIAGFDKAIELIIELFPIVVNDKDAMRKFKETHQNIIRLREGG